MILLRIYLLRKKNIIKGHFIKLSWTVNQEKNNKFLKAGDYYRDEKWWHYIGKKENLWSSC